ncbi:MAG: hypothetical protein WCP45_06730 [Verrucomicrobiota bacterium]
MSATDHYFTFPLAVLNGEDFDENDSAPIATPLNCIELALNCGIIGAGKGFKHRHGHDAFKARLEEICEKLDIGKARPGPCSDKGEVLVGADICNVQLGNLGASHLEGIAGSSRNVAAGGPLVTMKAGYFWAACEQARAEVDPKKPWPERGVSWREFRILCAILSVKVNRQGFCFVGWETIQARSCGFATKEAFSAATVIPDHLAPPLTRKQIRDTADTLEALGFYARFRMSSGPRGGLMAYSFRHKDQDALGNAVCEAINFRDRANIKANRAKDAQKCLQLLERAKSGPSQGQVRAK